NEERAYFSDYDLGLEVVAPGEGIKSAYWTQTRGYYYEYMSGTSMAAPHVSGVVALLISHGITDPDYIRIYLRETARDLYEPGYDYFSGYGLVDAFALLNRFQNTYVFFGELDDNRVEIKSEVVEVNVDGSF